jgi:hypothetical protein
MANATNEASLPWMIDVDVQGSPKSNIGALANFFSSAAWIYRSAMAYTTPAIDNEVTWDVLLAKGTWTLEIMAVTQNQSGIITASLDGTTLGTMDLYTASSTGNVMLSISAISVAESGNKVLKFKMATKNGSSSDYQMILQMVRLRRTA